MKTIKQIADSLCIDKQRVYRFIKRNYISEAHHEAGVMYYSDADVILITRHFENMNRINEVHHEAHQTTSSDTVIDSVVTMLKYELEAKNNLIASLQAELADERKHSREQAEKLASLADTSQRLTAGLLHQNLLEARGVEAAASVESKLDIISEIINSMRSEFEAQDPEHGADNQHDPVTDERADPGTSPDTEDPGTSPDTEDPGTSPDGESVLAGVDIKPQKLPFWKRWKIKQ